MNISVGQLSAVAAMLQFSSNKQGTICEINRLVAIPPSVAYSKENSGSYWASATVLNFSHKQHSLSSCFGKQESLLLNKVPLESLIQGFFFFEAPFLKITLFLLK